MTGGAGMIFPAIKLRTKLQLSFLLIGFVSILITGWQAYESAKTALEDVTFQWLTAMRESRREQIEYYFTRVQTDIRSYARDRSVIEAARELMSVFPDARREAGDAARLLDMVQGAAQPQANALREYLRALRRHDTQIETFRALHGYYDIFLVTANNGDVVYTARRETDFATNLRNGPYSNSNLAAVVSLLHDDSDTVRFVDFLPYEPSGMRPASFVATPVYDGGAMIAVLVFQLSIDDINGLMTGGNRRSDGMGSSGETYIVGTDLRMRNDSRFFIEQPARYLKTLRDIGTDSAIVGAIERNRTSVLLQEVRTSASLAALRGETDTREVEDYRGVRVLSSFTPLRIPDLHWVMLSEIDETEAFRAVYALRERLILIGLVILLFAFSLGVTIARTITRPILSLAEVAESFGGGKLDERAAVEARDEIGLLGSTFNTMAEQVQEHTTRLQSEIEVRIKAEEQLMRSEEQLRNLSTHLQSVREEERKRLAREIHDELGQRLTTMKLHLSLLRDDARDEQADILDGMESAIANIDATIQAVKRLISELRPGLLDDLGLTAAIEWQAEDFQRRTGIRCEVSISPHDIALDQDRSTAVFRIFQETLTNVARHASATHVTVYLTDNGDEVELITTDNGRGITREEIDDPRSFGLLGIRERAHAFGGTVDISGTPNVGTVVSAMLPKAQEFDA